MRLVMVLNSPVWGGLERYTVDLAAGLAERGHDVHVLASPGGPVATRLAATKVAVHELDLGLLVGYHSRIGVLNGPLFLGDLRLNPLRRRLTRALDEIERGGRIDLLHAQHVKEKLWVTQAGNKRGVPVAWTVHAPLESWMVEGVPRRVHEWGAQHVEGVIAVNDAARASYVDFGYPAQKVVSVHNGIRLDEYVGGDGAKIHAELAITPAETVFLLPARPYESKGVGTVLDALALLKAGSWARTGGRPVRLLIAGESRHVLAFESRAQVAGLGRFVHFLGHRDDMRDLYAAADVVTLPSFAEGLPYVIIEAMAAGRAVIASDVGGIPEMIDHGVSGLMVKPGDTVGLADSFASLVVDEAVREQIAQAGRRVAEQRFALDTMLARTEAAFARIADGQPL